jgi:hypothetical protein
MSVRVHISDALKGTTNGGNHGHESRSSLVRSLERWPREDVVRARRLALDAAETVLLRSDERVLEVFERRLSRGSAL